MAKEVGREMKLKQLLVPESEFYAEQSCLKRLNDGQLCTISSNCH